MSCRAIPSNRELRRRSRPGFTLVELMVVVVIIGLLAGAVTLSVRTYLIAGKQSVTKLEISKIVQALDTYYSAFDRYPSNDEGIESLSEPSSKFPDGLLSKLPVDPWGNPYEYTYPGPKGGALVACYGADAREGGTGADSDITSDQLDVE